MRLELKKIQAENAALAQRVQAGREAITQTEHRISTTVNEWKVRGKIYGFIKKENRLNVNVSLCIFIIQCIFSYYICFLAAIKL